MIRQRRSSKGGLFIVGAILVLLPGSIARTAQSDWPAVTREMKPWTRWWWMGSAVDPAHLTTELEALRQAGIGGVEITPIYGVRGVESRFIPYLSPAWTGLLEHTLREAQRLDLGVDMATGTGWPFGGPWVGADDASRTVVARTYTLRAGERLREPVRVEQTPLVRAVRGDPPALVEPIEANRDLQALAIDQVKFRKTLPLQTLMAYADDGRIEDLTIRVAIDGMLDWTPSSGTWTLYALFQGWHGKLVERAAPGGEGTVIDHFSTSAIRRYLSRFDTAFAGRTVAGIRAFFNDSYEVDDAAGQADWTPALLDEFQRRRGYDLRRQLPALVGRDTDERNARVLSDYRETISDLLLETFTTTWREWAHARGAIVRNQAHGSPASILDLYAASDIPETEGTEVHRIWWASSAAHVAGRALVSAETATWLGEHFQSTLADVRAAIDRYFLGGINHIVYHGTNYSPPDEPWPGWLFYAAVHFNPRNPWWTDFAALNLYVTRVQSFLQAGSPDNDVLLYFPLSDAFAVRGGGLLEHFGGPQPPLPGSAFESAAERLIQRGYTVDFISDRQLLTTRAVDGVLATGGSTYRVLMLPASRYIPLATLERVHALAREGATVLVFDAWPADVAGLHDLERRRTRYKELIGAVRFASQKNGVQEAQVGRGRVLMGRDLDALVATSGVARESMVDGGLRFVRRRHATGHYYFIANQGPRAIDGWVGLATEDRGAMVFEPMSGRHGATTTRRSADRLELYLQLGPGETVVVSTDSSSRAGTPLPLYTEAGRPEVVTGTWTVRFLSGGPGLPKPTSIDRLASWTTFGSDETRNFSGTAGYTLRFPRPTAKAGAWRLDLGDVRHSARVRLNDRDLGTLIGPAFTVVIDAAMLAADNRLEIDVTNLMANRIADLDRRNVPWKKFYNINFPSRLPENRGPDGLFTAAKWPPLESGLLGPVTLTPLMVRR
jgi:hypothetical protein